MRYVATGCAGSGTAWVAQVMTALGSSCGHQQIYRANRVVRDPRLEGDASFFAAGRLPDDIPVLVVVRDPLDVVRSLSQTTLLGEATPDHQLTKAYVCSRLPEVWDAPDRLGRLLRFVAWWDRLNRLALHLQVDRCTPEDVADAFEHLTGGAVDPNRAAGVMAGLGTKVNSHDGHRSTLRWDDVESHPDGHLLAAKARRWGYR